MTASTTRKQLRWDDQSIIFVAVSTAQGIANLPPILELADAGRDHVIFLQTPRAESAGWSSGPMRVMTARGITSEVQAVPEDLAQWRQTIAVLAPQMAASWDARLVFVANGGTKPMLLSALAGLTTDSRFPAMVYSADEPIALEVQQEGWGDPARRFEFTRGRPSLSEVLDCAGYEGRGEKMQKIWPGSVDLGRDSYGEDIAATLEIHREAFRASARQEALRESSTPSFDKAALFAPQKDLDAFANGLRGLWSDKDADPMDLARTTYGRCLKFMRERRAAAMSEALRVAAPTPIGDRFEDAVARRVHAWLGAEMTRSVVTECWRNANLFPAGGGDSVAELDLVFVMANGRLVSLEQKSSLQRDGSSTGATKDLFSRVMNLQNASSRVAGMYVCAPVYTAAAGESWFRELDDDMEKHVRARRLPFIGFTLPDQPAGYTVRQSGGKLEEVPVPPFEQRLRGLFM